MWGDIAIAFLLAFVTTFVFTPYTIKLANKLGAVDTPKDERRINTKTMPRLGGLAVISGFVVSMLYLIIVMNIEGTMHFAKEYKTILGFFLGAFIITGMCFIDDIKGIPSLLKLASQIIAAIIVVRFGIRI